MRIAQCGFILLAGVLCLSAQPAGMPNAWDIHKTLEGIAAHAESLTPLLEQVQPENWVSHGAPEAYIAQAKTCRVQLKAVATEARTLSRSPENLPAVLQTLFRIRTLEAMLASLGEGLRKYQNPPMADLLNRAVAENTNNLDRLQQYVLALATAREQDCHVADEEAQRCRESLSKQPARVAPSKQERD